MRAAIEVEDRTGARTGIRVCKRCGPDADHDGRACPNRVRRCDGCGTEWKIGTPGIHNRNTCPRLEETRRAEEKRMAYARGRDLAAIDPTAPEGYVDRKTGVQLPERWSPEFDRGFVEARVEHYERKGTLASSRAAPGAEIPRHHQPWKIFPVGWEDRQEHSPGAYDRAVEGIKVN